MLFFLVGVGVPSGILPVAQSTYADLQVYPSLPEPNEEVRASINRPLGEGEIARWFLNGTEVSAGRETVNTFPAPRLGSEVVVTAVIERGGTVVFDRSVVIYSAEIDVLIEGDTTVPPFYRGLPIPTRESGVNIVVLVHTIKDATRLKNSEILFTWERQGATIREREPGAFIERVPENKTTRNIEYEVGVEIPTFGSAQRIFSITIPNFNVWGVRVYEHNLTQGVFYNKVIGDVSPQVDVVRAEPFFLPKKKFHTIVWRVDGEEIGRGESDLGITPPTTRDGMVSVEAVLERKLGGWDTEDTFDFILEY